MSEEQLDFISPWGLKVRVKAGVFGIMMPARRPPLLRDDRLLSASEL